MSENLPHIRPATAQVYGKSIQQMQYRFTVNSGTLITFVAVKGTNKNEKTLQVTRIQELASPPSLVCVCPLLKMSLGNPYLEILEPYKTFYCG